MSSTDYDSDVSVSSDENPDQSTNLDFTGKILKNYNIISELGRGSYSIVWLAYNISDSNFVIWIACGDSMFFRFFKKIP